MQTVDYINVYVTVCIFVYGYCLYFFFGLFMYLFRHPFYLSISSKALLSVIPKAVSSKFPVVLHQVVLVARIVFILVVSRRSLVEVLTSVVNDQK